MEASLLLVDDDRTILSALRMILENDYRIITAENGAEALKRVEDHPPDLVLLDIGLPDISGMDLLEKIKKRHPETVAVMATAVDGVKTVVQALKMGAYDYLLKPIDAQELKLTIQNALENRRLKDQIRRIQQPHAERYQFDMIGRSPQVRHLIEVAKKIDRSVTTPVLILGESGSGKGMLAKAIHYNYSDLAGPFVSINCTAVPHELFESELFGYVKGAFTGAKPEGKKGRLEESVGGTIFLDEIGAMSLPLQSKLLGVLDDRVFYKVGGNQPVPISSRIIAATNTNLKKAVAKGAFRRDLYYRLNVIKMKLPPLRERPDDIIPLTEHFMEHYSRKFNKDFKGISSGARKILLRYSWPGNVRELRNTLERVSLLEDFDVLRAEHIHFLQTDSEAASLAGIDPHKGLPGYEEAVKMLIKEALRRTRGNVLEAANLLRMPPHKLRYRIKKYALKN